MPFGAMAFAMGIENAPEPEPISATISPGLSRSFAITSETFRSLLGSSILWMYLSAGSWSSWANAWVAAMPERIRITQQKFAGSVRSLIGWQYIPKSAQRSSRQIAVPHQPYPAPLNRFPRPRRTQSRKFDRAAFLQPGGSAFEFPPHASRMRHELRYAHSQPLDRVDQPFVI